MKKPFFMKLSNRLDEEYCLDKPFSHSSNWQSVKQEFLCMMDEIVIFNKVW
ncbi:hypothetical protein [Bacillus sp. EAC]|uniref:hypothetical protein n=1 Tax=Bacillus sp. EAC TaxID=1978338 RepID=UPI001C4E7C09|nr:hypothetical protein [Bacillus sp. EAC]